MIHTLLLNKEKIAVCKSINYTDVLTENEIEITEEQYNSIKTPCKLTIENGEVIAWEKTILPPVEPVAKEPTFEERLKASENAINNLLGL